MLVKCPSCGAGHELLPGCGQTAVSICCNTALLVSVAGEATDVPPPPEVKALRHPDFRLTGYISQGSTAVILSGVDLNLQRTVALKIAKLSGRQHDRLQSLSAQKTAALRHPAVPAIYSVQSFEDVVSGHQHRVVVMDLVRGAPLAAFGGSRRHEIAARVVLENLCDVLRACHQVGFFHGDLEHLENVLVSPPATVHVIDAGVSQLGPAAPHFTGFREADLRSLVAAASLLFERPLAISIQPDDDVTSVQKRLEYELATDLAAANLAYSLDRRLELITNGDPRWQFAGYSLVSEAVQLTISPSGRTEHEIVSTILPLHDLDHLNQICFFSEPVTLEELHFTAELLLDDSATALPVTLERQAAQPYETVFYYRIAFPTPLAKGGLHRVSIHYAHPHCMSHERDSWSYDATAYMEELRASFVFLDCPRPTAWALYHQLAGRRSLERLSDEGILLLQPDSNRADVVFRGVRPPSAVHVYFGPDEASVRAD